jgi:DNA processing protein
MWREWSPEDLIGPLNEVERKNAPERLFLAGDADLLRSGRRVSIVGSRKVSPEGASRTRGLVKVLVEREITVVSGLAEGVDTAAHETAMNEGGRTIAVLGTPLDKHYPTCASSEPRRPHDR